VGFQRRTQVLGHGLPRRQVCDLLDQVAATARGRFGGRGVGRQLRSPAGAEQRGAPRVGPAQEGQHDGGGASGNRRRTRGHSDGRQGHRGNRPKQALVHDFVNLRTGQVGQQRAQALGGGGTRRPRDVYSLEGD